MLETSGIFVDKQTGLPIKGVIVTIVDNAGDYIYASTVTDNEGYFGLTLNMSGLPQELWLLASKDNYQSVLIKPAGPDLYTYELDPIAAGSLKKKIDWGLIIGGTGLALGVLSTLNSKKKKVAGMNPATQTILLYVGGGLLLYFGVISPLLKKLGILKSEEAKELDNASADPGSFWNPDFWQKITNANILTISTADNIIDTIANAFSIWNDDENVIYGQFRRLTHKAQVSFLAYRFLQRYNADFLSWLRGGDEWYADNLSDQEVASINDYLKKLPN